MLLLLQRFLVKNTIHKILPPKRHHFELPHFKTLRFQHTPPSPPPLYVQTVQNDQTSLTAEPPQTMSKKSQRRLLKQQRSEARKAEMKEHKKNETERKRIEWEDKLASVSEQEREKLIEERIQMRKDRMERRSEEKVKKMERFQESRISGQNVVIDLEFSDRMSSVELYSLAKQIMYCYAINGRCASPAHLWLTGCQGEMENELRRFPGYDKWFIEKESRSYVEAFHEQKENLVYLTPDSENVLDELDPKAIYIVGGLVDKTKQKGVTLKKAKEQGIKTAKLPIGTYLKIDSSEVLTVNQVVEIILTFVETKDWKASCFHVIPQRKRCESGSGNLCDDEDSKNSGTVELEADDEDHEDGEKIRLEGEDQVSETDQKMKRQCLETLIS